MDAQRTPPISNELTFYGFPDECRKFQERHPLWREIMPNLERASNLAFARTPETNGPADKLIFLFGRLCVEDFMEITLVCHHGYGVAASKLVRSMYEKAVTLYYLHEHPEEAQAFIDYHRIQQDRLLTHVIETFGPVSIGEIDEVRRRAAEVKKDFMVPVCEHPGASKRLRHSWSTLDFVSMAKKTGELGTLIVPGYYLPLRHSHPTFAGLKERLEIVEGNLAINPKSQPEEADRALMTAHNCLLTSIEVQKKHFGIAELEKAIDTCVRDFARVWAPDSDILKA